MALTSSQFLLFVAIVILAFNAVRGPHLRMAILTIANLIFIFSFVDSGLQLIPLIVFLAVGFFSARFSSVEKKGINAVLIAVVIFLFMYLKRYAFLGPIPTLPFIYLSIGLSYILFRMLQLIIDRSFGEEQAPLTVLEFFNFTCNFLCFISGPIQRSSQFLEDQQRMTRQVDEDLAYRAFRRVIVGYVKVTAISGIANFVFTGASQRLFGLNAASLQTTVAVYSLAVATYTTYLFFNFSGYMDIVIGFGWLLGQELPENFNRPFKARNLFEFWARWHMTLSEWFKTYLFNPLLGSFASRITNPRAMTSLGVVAFFVTFFVMGVWHGSTLVFVIYGLVMGAGVSLNKVWQIYLQGRLGKKGMRMLGEHWLYAAGARGITIAFFSIAVTALWVDWSQLHYLVSEVRLAGLLLSFALLTVLAAFFFPIFDWLEAKAAALYSAAAPILASPIGQQAVLGIGVLFVVAVNSFFHKPPEFVYKAF